MADIFFGDPFRRLLWRPTTVLPRSSTSPAADWLETPSSHIIRLDVPGFGREEIKVQIEEGNVLEVKGEPSSSPSSAESEAKDAVWYLAERPEKEGFSRRFDLPDGVRADQVLAQVDKGVITILAPKEARPAKLKPRAVPVSSKL